MRSKLDIAIVGMACRFPGARDLAAFWENVLAGRDCTSDVPPDRWDPAVFFDPDSTANDRVYCQCGGYLDAPIEFDPAAHGTMPLAVEGGEPEQFLVLDAARAALADAGMAAGVADGRRVEIVIGRGNYFNRGNLTRLQHGRIVAQTLAILRELHPGWSEADFEAVRADLKASLPPFEPGTIAGQLTNATAGRVADRLNLSGASYVVDAASASALVALDLGARALVDRRADLALVGAVYIATDVDFPLVFCRLGALSRRGQARPFARDADGTLPGEGVGVVVLKRRADAERDGDRIYAVLQGVGLASDGRGSGLAAPSARGHARAIRRAYRRSGIDPATVELIEGHGLGVPAADRAELRALRAIFPATARGRRILGAVSGLIGHAMPAAGMAGLIKTALALHHRVLPPSPSAGEPHPLLVGDDSPCALNPSARPWVHGDEAHPRRAGVNAFGFAGINAHAVLEEHSATADGVTSGCLPRWESEAVLLGAPDRARWLEVAAALLDWLERGANLTVPLKDLAYTLNTGQPAFPFRVGLVATTTADLRDRLRVAMAKLADPSCRAIHDASGTYFWEEPLGKPGALAFLYPGEGSQYPGMLADLCPHFPEVRTLFDTADRVTIQQGRAQLPSEVLFGEATDDANLWSMGTAITIVLSAQRALHQLLTKLGLRPDAVLGHSSGEFLSLAAAGVLRVDRTFEDAIGRLGNVFEGLEGSGRVPAAALIAVAADRDRVAALCRELGDGLVVAMDNCPHQVVVSGPPPAAAKLVERLRGQGVFCETLPFARAYHTGDFTSALGPVRDFFNALALERPLTPVYSCAVAGRMGRDREEIRRWAVEQWALPVAFRPTIEAMYADGIRVFVEVGTRGNLTGFVADTLRGRPHFAIAANLPKRSGLTQLNHLMASLYAHGAGLLPDLLYARRRPSRIDFAADLPERPVGPVLKVGFPEMRLSPELAATLRGSALPAARSDRNGREHENGHANGDRFTWPSALPESRRNAAPMTAAREELMLAHLQTMDDFLDTQRQVMDAYLTARGRKNGEHGTMTAEPEARQGGGRAPGPWVGTVETLVPGRELVAVRRLDARDDPVAEHHTLGGRRVSALDPERKGLPVVPFTVMAEMLAQAAAVLVPDQEVVQLRDVQAHKWIRYEEQPFELELRARREPDRPDEVHVTIHNQHNDANGVRRPAAESPLVAGTIIFASARPDGPEAPQFALEAERACRFTAEELYDDQWLFHGPALQALTRVGRASPHGIEGTLRVLPRRGLLRESDRLDLKTDPVVLDAFTHLLGCWGLDEYADGEGDVIFPLRLGALTLFGTDPPEGTEVACRIAIREVTRHKVRVDADFVGPDGRLWMRLNDWEDWRFYWPGRYRDQFRAPDRILLGEPLELPGATVEEAQGLRAVWLESPADMSKPVWRDVLEWVQLGPEERARHESRPGTQARRTMRLFGRIAAKSAVRLLWRDRGGAPVFPADLAIEPDPRSRPWVRSLLEAERRDLPAVSIAHIEGTAVALAALDPNARIGVDLERIVARPPEFEEIAFAEGERAWFRAHPELDRDEWFTRFWCAKEAVAKATGFGMLVGPASVIVSAADPVTGALAVTLGTDLTHACPDWGTAPVRAVTERRGDIVWAWTMAREWELS